MRTWKEHIGQVSGYNYIGPAGRIAGDVWGNCGTDAYHMQHYRNLDNTMRPYPEIAANWAEADITPDKCVAFYCGTGWRAAETWFYADLMGWQDVAVYDGGWFEWSAGPGQQPHRGRRPGRRRGSRMKPTPTRRPLPSGRGASVVSDRRQAPAAFRRRRRSAPPASRRPARPSRSACSG